MPFSLPDAVHLRERLRRFLEIHNKTKILDASEGSIRMHILHAKNTKNDKIKDKMINDKLARLDERIFGPLEAKDLFICEFLIEELEKYVASQLER